MGGLERERPLPPPTLQAVPLLTKELAMLSGGAELLLRRTCTVGFPACDQGVRKVMYEVIVVAAVEAASIGWATSEFEATDRHDGRSVGDDANSWGFDGSGGVVVRRFVSATSVHHRRT